MQIKRYPFEPRNAGALALFRLRAALDRTLVEPGWMLAVQARLQLGQAID